MQNVIMSCHDIIWFTEFRSFSVFVKTTGEDHIAALQTTMTRIKDFNLFYLWSSALKFHFISVSHVLNNITVFYILYMLSAANNHNFRWLICQMIIHFENYIIRLITNITPDATFVPSTSTNVTFFIHEVSA